MQREASVEILPRLQTPISGYDGVFPGPTIESRSGRRAVIRHSNELPVPVVVHLHGGHTPAAGDGYPTDLVLPQSADAQDWLADDMAGDVSQGTGCDHRRRPGVISDHSFYA